MRKILIVGGLPAVLAVIIGVLLKVTAVTTKEILTVGGLVVVITVLGIIIILLLANLGIFFAKVSQSTTAFVVAGDKLRSIWPNVNGYRMSTNVDTEGRQWLIPSETNDIWMENFFRNPLFGTLWFQKWLWKEFGVRFVSWFWFNNKIHLFDIRSRKRVRERAEMKKEEVLRNRIVDSSGGETEVNNLLFLVPRPVYVEGVELAGDNSRVNLLLLPIFRQVIPSVPVFDLKGDFFTLLDAAIEAAVVDFFAGHCVAVNDKGEFVKDSFVEAEDKEKYKPSHLTYAHWLKVRKAGEGSPLEQRLRRLNLNKEYIEALGSRNELTGYITTDTHLNPQGQEVVPGSPPSGIVHRFGFALISIRSVEWEVHENTKGIAEALLAKETERHKAEGVREKAAGERDAAMAQADGDTSRYRLPVKSLIDLGVNPDVAATVLATQLRTENIRQAPGLATYVEGGASASILVDASKSKTST